MCQRDRKLRRSVLATVTNINIPSVDGLHWVTDTVQVSVMHYIGDET